MLSVDEALHAVLEQARPGRAADVPLIDALDLALSRDIAGTIDSPPYDKSLVDGFAVRAADTLDADNKLRAGPIKLLVQEEITAGAVPTLPLTEGRAARIMTGAPLPEGTDGVVMLEETESMKSGDDQTTTDQSTTGQSIVVIRSNAFSHQQNILLRGTSMRKGDVVFRAGHRVTPAAVGLLAEIGCSQAPVIAPPRVSILSTGNELVPIDAEPRGGQIRNSNGPMLAAQVRDAGAIPVDLGIARDEIPPLRSAVETGLTTEILVLSGGVSAGDLDLAPGVFRELGVREVFHKVKLKPGKPLWFGVREDETKGSSKTDGEGCHSRLVFGLPGNPVGSFVCFELFVRPAILRMMGHSVLHRPHRHASLEQAVKHRGGRPTYFPAILETTEEYENAPTVRLLNWQGSADLRRVAEANALAVLPADAREFAAGERVQVMLL